MKKLTSFLPSSLTFHVLKAGNNSTLRRIFLILLISFSCYGCQHSDLNELLENNFSKKILIDASHDGGTWWYPQSPLSGFSQSLPHQGKLLADFLRSKGFIVDELPANTLITTSILQQYSKVIRASFFLDYKESELIAYDKFLKGKSSLFLISDYLRPDVTDQLSQKLGIDFSGIYQGDVTLYAPHAITEGATPFHYKVGSIITNENNNPNIQVLGWLDGKSSMPVMGILKHRSSKIFFLGEMNGIEDVPQPLTSNIVKWLFE